MNSFVNQGDTHLLGRAVLYLFQQFSACPTIRIAWGAFKKYTKLRPPPLETSFGLVWGGAQASVFLKTPRRF